MIIAQTRTRVVQYVLWNIYERTHTQGKFWKKKTHIATGCAYLRRAKRARAFATLSKRRQQQYQQRKGLRVCPIVAACNIVYYTRNVHTYQSAAAAAAAVEFVENNNRDRGGVNEMKDKTGNLNTIPAICNIIHCTYTNLYFDGFKFRIEPVHCLSCIHQKIHTHMQMPNVT